MKTNGRRSTSLQALVWARSSLLVLISYLMNTLPSIHYISNPLKLLSLSGVASAIPCVFVKLSHHESWQSIMYDGIYFHGSYWLSLYFFGTMLVRRHRSTNKTLIGTIILSCQKFEVEIQFKRPFLSIFSMQHRALVLMSSVKYAQSWEDMALAALF